VDKLKKLVKKLDERKLTLSLAESITGGYASYLLTKIPGASKIFKGGYVVYSLDTKEKLFKVKASLLRKTQGVSAQIASLLAAKVRVQLNSDIGSAIVGFAGPTTGKGVKLGTVYLAVNYKNKTEVKKIILNGSRDNIRKKAAQLLVDFIYEKVVSCKL
jgi:nicotinamide-nucleotide amidase